MIHEKDDNQTHADAEAAGAVAGIGVLVGLGVLATRPAEATR